MATGVRCLEYPQRKKEDGSARISGFRRANEFFPEPRNRGEFVVDCGAKDTLIRLLPGYRISRYLERAPWMIEIAQRGFLEVYRIDDGESDMNIEELVGSERIAIARRKSSLSLDEKEKMVEVLLWELRAENYIHSRDKTGIYADVLQALGKEVSRAQVSEMVSKQLELWDKERHASWLREAGAWNALGEIEPDMVGV
jgi:hypothetical protein